MDRFDTHHGLLELGNCPQRINLLLSVVLKQIWLKEPEPKETQDEILQFPTPILLRRRSTRQDPARVRRRSQGEKCLHKNFQCQDVDPFPEALQPFRDKLVVGCESTFTWSAVTRSNRIEGTGYRGSVGNDGAYRATKSVICPFRHALRSTICLPSCSEQPARQIFHIREFQSTGDPRDSRPQ